MSKFLSEDFLDKTPELYAGGVLANTLGFQVFRILYQNFWRLKPKKVNEKIKSYIDIMERDGILVIPDFFSVEQFTALKNEYEQSYSDWSPYEFNENELTDRQKVFTEYFEAIAEKVVVPNTPVFTKYFLNNRLILDIASAVVHKENRLVPYHHFWYQQRRTLENKNVCSTHSASYPHADVNYPTIKVFFYLNDVDESNAPYVYAKGSHKLTLKRIMIEYKLSIQYAKSKSYSINNEDIAKLGYKPEPICAKSNTLIISNNMGYHNRGEFKTLTPRQTAQLDFRSLESWRNTLNRNDKSIISRAMKKLVKSIEKSKREKLRANLGHTS